MNQREDILFLLKAGMELTALDAMKRGVGRLAARIEELRQQGHDITTDMRPVRKGNGKTATIAYYKLERTQPELF